VITSGVSTHIAERGTHDNGFIAVLLVIIENHLNRLNTRIFIAFIGLSCSLLVPIKNLFGMEVHLISRPNKMHTHTANEGRDQSNTSLSASNSLTETKKESKVAMNIFIPLQFTSGLDTLPG